MRGAIEAAGYKLRDLPSSVGAAIGSGTHTAVAHDLTHKMEHGAFGSVDEAVDLGINEMELRIAEEGVMWDEVSPNLSDAQKQVRRLARTYREQIGERITPAAVERRLNAAITPALTLSGQQDVVVAEPSTLRDLKTGKMASSNWGQYGAYSMLLRAHGVYVDRIVEDFVKRSPLRSPQDAVREIEYDIVACEQQTERVIGAIQDDLARWDETGEREAFLPNPSSSLCTDRFCPAWGTSFCPMGKKR